MMRLVSTALQLTALLALVGFTGCKKEEVEPALVLNLPATPYNYANPDLPEHFFVESEGMHGQLPLMETDNTPRNNKITDEGATLGRVLFYDLALSKNGAVACASCHIAELGFSDDRELSEGFEGGLTGRHSMGLTNARFYQQGHFFWDQRAETLEDQVLMPMQDPVEMGMTLEEVVDVVKGQDIYAPLFKDAFGDDKINSRRISLALAQFVRSMVSYGSKYDKGRAKVERRSDWFPNFTKPENRGKDLFVLPPPMGGAGCFVCHQGEGFVAQEATNNGLDINGYLDPGYGEVTGNARDDSRFKVPSLRNVGLRAPYMHDGRFATLEKVIGHYSSDVKANPNLGPPFFVDEEGEVAQLELSQSDQNALVAFLNTLTDEEMVNDVKFSDPFVNH